MYLFQATGNPLEAEKETERAPDAWSFPMLESKVRLLVYGGDCRTALAILDRWPVATQPKSLQGLYVRIEGVWRTTCGQPARGHQVLLRALKLWNELLLEQPKQPFFHHLRGLTLADLGRKEEAIAEIKVAFDLFSGNLMSQNSARHGLAEIYSVTGEHKAALDLIDELLKEPAGYPLTLHELRFAPWWKPLWNEPRFQALLRQERRP
jgi:tetratricopeptide (TPR) repeat protein